MKRDVYGRNKMCQHTHIEMTMNGFVKMKNGNNQVRETDTVHMKSGNTKDGGKDEVD